MPTGLESRITVDIDNFLLVNILLISLNRYLRRFESEVFELIIVFGM